MKTLTLVTVMVALASGSAYARGSKVTKSTLINASKNTLTNTQAIGKNSSANTGSMSVRGSKVTKSTLINASKNTLTNTQAIGKNSVANTGSLDVR